MFDQNNKCTNTSSERPFSTRSRIVAVNENQVFVLSHVNKINKNSSTTNAPYPIIEQYDKTKQSRKMESPSKELGLWEKVGVSRLAPHGSKYVKFLGVLNNRAISRFVSPLNRQHMFRVGFGKANKRKNIFQCTDQINGVLQAQRNIIVGFGFQKLFVWCLRSWELKHVMAHSFNKTKLVGTLGQGLCEIESVIHVNPGEDYPVVASTGNDGTICFWDVYQGTLMRTFSLHTNCRFLSAHPEGRLYCMNGLELVSIGNLMYPMQESIPILQDRTKYEPVGLYWSPLGRYALISLGNPFDKKNMVLVDCYQKTSSLLSLPDDRQHFSLRGAVWVNRSTFYLVWESFRSKNTMKSENENLSCKNCDVVQDYKEVEAYECKFQHIEEVSTNRVLHDYVHSCFVGLDGMLTCLKNGSIFQHQLAFL